MSDKVEVFLTHLPLLRVPNKSISGQDEKVSAEFKNGDIMKTSWRTRDAPISATAWSFLCAPETQVPVPPEAMAIQRAEMPVFQPVFVSCTARTCHPAQVLRQSV